MAEITGAATGIGSLPHTDVDAALDLIFKYVPQIPFWPQLPKRNIREGMIAQFSEGIPCLRVSQAGVSFDSSSQEQELAEFYEHIITDDSGYFAVSSDFASGFWQFLSRLEKEDIGRVEFIKGQITGPFTFAASINDKDGKAVLHNPVFMQAVHEGLAIKARWQIDMFKKFGKSTMLFLDEPYLACLGSGFTPINRQEVIAGLSEFTKKIKSQGRVILSCQQDSIDAGKDREDLIAVHCCGNTDWSIFTEVSGIDIISFDAFNFLDRVLLYASQLRAFFTRGGILAWGIVPTQDFSSSINTAMLIEKLEAGLDLLVKKGVEEDLFKNRLIITPSCGLGVLDSKKAESIFKCLSGVSCAMSKKYLTK